MSRFTPALMMLVALSWPNRLGAGEPLVNLIFEPEEDVLALPENSEDGFRIKLIAKTNQGETQDIIGMNVFFSWEPADALRVTGLDNNGPHNWDIGSVLPPPPFDFGLNGDNDDPEDGSAYYFAGSFASVEIASDGLLVTTFLFEALREECSISLAIETKLEGQSTSVTGPGGDVVGNLGSTVVYIIEPGGMPADDDGDGIDDGCDLCPGTVKGQTVGPQGCSCEQLTDGQGEECDDDLFCNGVEGCADGVCTPGSDPCDGQSCNEEFDKCGVCENDESCDDGQFCNGTEICDPGDPKADPFGCVAGAAPVCDDSIACTDDVCDPSANGNTGACVFTPNDDHCDDGQFCNGDETCDAVNGCQAGAVPDCTVLNDDGVGCTVDECDPSSAVGAGACVNTPSDALCDDDQFCNGDETCDAVNDCQPGTNPDCAVLNDDGVACTVDECDPHAADGTGACVNTPNDGLCDNSLFCAPEICDPVSDCQVTDDPCDALGLACVEALDGCFCNDAAQCDDGIDCTDDTCEGTPLSICVSMPNDADCADGLFCNGAETCDPVNGCQGDTSPCGPDEVCNEDTEQCEIAGDCDHDGDVDLFDYECFVNCVTGSGGGIPPGCEMFDFDGDGDVDLLDWRYLQIAFTGSR